MAIEHMVKIEKPRRFDTRTFHALFHPVRESYTDVLTMKKLKIGYDTEVGELGDTLSGGEKQRIGIARAFLHECPLILLDEPTSNLDSLNEGIILKSLKESAKKKTVVLVSHRVSTMNVADVVYEMENGRIS